MKFCTAWLFGMLIWMPGFAIAQESVTVTRITGEQRQIVIESIVDGVLVGADTKIILADLMMIQTDRSLVPEDAAFLVMMSGGGELAATGIEFNGERFLIFTDFGRMLVPPDAVMGVLVDHNTDRSRFDRALKNRSVEQDIVVAKTTKGQGVVRGLMESIDDARVVLNHDGKSRSISMAKLVGFVTADLMPSKPAGQPATVTLINGSTLTGGIVRLESGVVNVALPGNATVDLSLENIVSISLQSDRVVFLSDLEPTDVSTHALATQPFTWQRDVSVLGNPLQLYSWKTGTVTEYAKGIGTHSASRLEFENTNGFNRFLTTVGIDTETEGKGDCLVAVWADGIKLWEGEIAGSRDPLKVDVDISGMKRIALVVRDGQHLDLGDHVNWTDARFLQVDD